MKKQKKSKKLKDIKPIMKFNPGTQKYEPQLPLRKGRSKIKINWLLVIILIILFIFLIYFFIKIS